MGANLNESANFADTLVMNLRSNAAGASNLSLASWIHMLHALPVPAAIVDHEGVTIAANRWIGTWQGEQLLRPSTDDSAPGLALGHNSDSRWRVRPLDEEAEYRLATAEREDAGDHLLRQFFSSGDALFVVYDQAGRVIESNAAWANLLGYSAEEVFGLDSWSLLPPDEVQVQQVVEAELRLHSRSEPRFHMRNADGQYRLVQWALHFDAAVGRCFGIGRDITEEGKEAAELHRRAYTDELTGLSNRAHLLLTLDRFLEGTGLPAVLFCDLDHFKLVNDSLGHSAGDALLAALGRRLESLKLGPESLVSRLGGDEFVVLLSNADEEYASMVAREMLELMSSPFIIAGRSLHVGMSIGIALTCPTDTRRSSETLLSEADTAVYEAKDAGRNKLVVFDDALRSANDRRVNVEAGLRDALQNDGLEVHYQPIVDVVSKEIVGVEALVRWRRSDGELVGPGGFLDVAEDAGLLPAIGLYVMEHAMRLGAEFSSNGIDMLISVNVSAQEVSNARLVDDVQSLLRRTGMQASNLLLEITESAVLNTDVALPLLHELRDVGVSIGLDDFGTGFSSLAHLRTLPIDVVKVDRSFVGDLVTDEVTRAVTESLLSLCDALGLFTILEGVETADQSRAVEAMGGGMAQGFLYYRPMPANELRSLLIPPLLAAA